ncbi:hypothetical protein P9112_000911 [Eukaryota sp. TZLM1-RC]
MSAAPRSRRSLLDSPRTPKTPFSKHKIDAPVSLEDVKPVDGRITLNKLRLKSLSGLRAHPKTEFLYLRDNCLSVISNIPIMKNVKILDVGYNELTSLAFLDSFPCLRQLYVNSNCLTSLSDMPSLPYLEHFSFTQNDISSFQDMPAVPELRVLCGSSNNISSFQGLPLLPNLEVLRLLDNPLSECMDYRILSTRVTNPLTLRKIDGANLSLSEKELAERLPLKMCYLCREGYLPSTLEEPCETANQWYLEQQRSLHPELLNISLDGSTTEEERMSVSFELSNQIVNQNDCSIIYEWLRFDLCTGKFAVIPGANEESYVLTSDDVDSVIKACVTVKFPSSVALDYKSATYSAISNDIVSAPPVLFDLEVLGSPVQGDVLTVNCRYSGGRQKGIEYQWYRSNLPIPNATSRTFVCQLEDVGHVISVSAVPIRNDGFRGETYSTKCSSVVKAALPTVTDVYVEGPFVEREPLCGYGTYFGGIEGNSIFQWFRVVEEGEERKYLEISDSNSRFYTPTAGDFGHRLVFQYTPISDAEVPGTPVSVITQPIGAGPPTVESLAIKGEVVEGKTLSVCCKYLGGIEGRSFCQWFCSSRIYEGSLAGLANNELEELFKSLESNDGSPDSSIWLVINGANKPHFTPTNEQIGRLLCCLYLPVRDDGAEGVARVAMSSEIVSAGQPTVMDIVLEGEVCQGSDLVGNVFYSGGVEGKSRYRWLRILNDYSEVVAENSLIYSPVNDDVGYYLRLEVVPVRADGLVGLPFCRDTSEVVVAGKPVYFDVGIDGEAVEGTELKMKGHYFGGQEGSSLIEWILINSNGKESVGAKNQRSFIITEDNVNMYICLRVIPIRVDGTEGDAVVTDPLGPIKAVKPVISDLEVNGSPVVDEFLTVTFDYSGSGTPLFIVDWYRKKQLDQTLKKISRQTSLDQSDCNALGYTIKEEDIGCFIHVEVSVLRREDDVTSELMVSDFGPVISDCPVISEIELPEAIHSLEPIEPQYVYNGPEEGQSIFSWSISRDSQQWTEVCNQKTFKPSENHVDHFVKCSIIPVSQSKVSGNQVTATSSQPISWGRPLIKNATLIYDDFNHQLCVLADYHGPSGTINYEWKRGTLCIHSGKAYSMHKDDIGHNLVVLLTAVADNGITGDSVKLSTGILSKSIVGGYCIPRDLNRSRVYDQSLLIDSMELIGGFAEGNEVCAKISRSSSSILYNCQWFLIDHEGKPNKLADCQSESIIPTLSHVGFRLQLQVAVDNQTFYLTTPQIQAGHPTCTELSLHGGEYNSKPLTIQAGYKGGHSGEPRINYYRVKEGQSILIEGVSNQSRYVPSADDVGCSIKVEYFPVRNDGLVGDPATRVTEIVSLHPSYKESVAVALSQKEVSFACLIAENSPRDFGKVGEERTFLLNVEKMKLRLPNDRTIHKSFYLPRIKTQCVGDKSFEVCFDDEGPRVHLTPIEKTQPRDLVLLCVRAFSWLASRKHPLTGQDLEGVPSSDKAYKKWLKNGGFTSLL